MGPCLSLTSPEGTPLLAWDPLFEGSNWAPRKQWFKDAMGEGVRERRGEGREEGREEGRGGEEEVREEGRK